MVENLLKALIILCLIVACVFLALWVLGQIGIVIPLTVVAIIWVVVVLGALLFLLRALGSSLRL